MIPLRDENPNRGVPFVTAAVIAANIFTFFYEVKLGSGLEAFLQEFALIPTHLLSSVPSIPEFLAPWTTLVTSLFLHGGIAHLIGNMWFLWIFGGNVEDFLGSIPYLLFYLLSGVSASLLHVILQPSSAIPLIGASGAISGVLGAYVILHPAMRIRTLVTLGFFWDVIYIPAWIFLGLWFGMQFFGLLGSVTSVAHDAHVGGFGVGMGLIFLVTRKSPVQPYYRFEYRRARRW